MLMILCRASFGTICLFCTDQAVAANQARLKLCGRRLSEGPLFYASNRRLILGSLIYD